MCAKGARAIRLLPCPSYDIEGLQSYFAAMAANGLHLKKDGIFAGFAAFERGEGANVRYRIDMDERRGILSDNAGRPDVEKIELCAELGWEYVDSYAEAHIYRCADNAAPELNTDAAIRSIAIKKLVKAQLSRVLWLIFWLLLYPLLKLGGLLLPTMFAVGSDIMLLCIALDACYIAFETVKLIKLRSLKRRLIAGESIANTVQRNSAAYILPRAAFALAVIIAACIFIVRWNDDVSGKNKIPLEEYGQKLPFATIADMAEGKYKQDAFPIANNVQTRSDMLAPIVIDYRETASVTREDDAVFSGGLLVDYYFTASEALAKATAAELERAASLHKNYEPISLAPLGVDSQAAYYDNAHMPCIILRKGNVVLKALLYQTGNYTIQMEAWAARLAASISAGE